MKLQKLFLLLASCTLLAGCDISNKDNENGSGSETTSEEVDVLPPNAKEYTIMIYMCGSNLESDYGEATANIAEMLSVNIDSSKMNLIIETGGSTKWKNYGISNSKLSRYHIIEVDGTGPVAGGVHAAAVSQVAAHFAFQLRDIAGRSGQRSEVTAGREAGRGHEGGVEAVLRGIGAHPAHDALDVLDLGRELGVTGRTVVRGHHGVARVQQGVHDGAEVGHALGVVGEPGAAVDVDHDGIGSLLHARQIDVQLVIHLVVAGIVDILELSGAVDIDFRHLEAAETAGRLCLE